MDWATNMPKNKQPSIADKYYGAVKVEKWPEDLDEYAKSEMQKRWKKHVPM